MNTVKQWVYVSFHLRGAAGTLREWTGMEAALRRTIVEEVESLVSRASKI